MKEKIDFRGLLQGRALRLSLRNRTACVAHETQRFGDAESLREISILRILQRGKLLFGFLQIDRAHQQSVLHRALAFFEKYFGNAAEKFQLDGSRPSSALTIDAVGQRQGERNR
ncbi:MAG TPA: hypothetical protein VMD78_00700 [Candidatus Baltobacteraceae bacterium]|nr:hypothetical protein [Candidatus Baltobacteraceae bacterium]